MAANEFKPALLVVDFQEDFCPPNGSLAVTNGRDISSVVNELLSLPFAIKVATQDWHPPDHISFASNHDGKKPFADFATVVNPHNPAESYKTRLWPDHCIQNSDGARLVPELDVSKIDKVIQKGTVRGVEMYSVFYDPFVAPRVSDSGLAGVLKDQGITDIYIVGLAADYCVKCSAIDACNEGFRTHLVEEGTRAVDPSEWEACRKEIEAAGVKLVSMSSPDVARLRGLSQI